MMRFVSFSISRVGVRRAMALIACGLVGASRAAQAQTAQPAPAGGDPWPRQLSAGSRTLLITSRR
jgi:hypothetical protein